MAALRFLPPGLILRIRDYGLVLAAVAIPLGLALLVDGQGLESLEMPLFLMAITVAVWFAGNGPGALSIALSSLAFNYFFTAPRHSFYIAPIDRSIFFFFVTFALLIGWFASRRRRIEHDLRQTRDRLMSEVETRTQQASLLDLTQDTIFVRDMSGVITHWNRGAQELYGWTAGQAIGRPSHQLTQTVFPIALDEIHTELLRSGRWEGEVKKTTASGSELVVASRWSLQLDDQLQPIAILETNNDITDRKQREERIRKLNADLEYRTVELEASNKELEAFAYSTSHDLRAPLRHLAGYAELLQRNAAAAMDDKGRRYLALILDAAKRMGRLIDDLLAFSRIGRTETRNTLVSLAQLAQEVLREAEVESEAGGRDIVWRVGQLPNVYGDRAMLRLALVNLVSNAMKFTRTRTRGEIDIGCIDADSDQVAVFVKDNGVGFDMKYVHKLFGVFQRLHGPEIFEGTGIGLATVHRIVTRHGGRVWAEGAVDKGATFYISAPRA